MHTDSLDVPLTDNQQQWLKHFQAAEAQNLPLADYAKQKNIDPNKLYSWKSQLKQKGFFGGTKKLSPAFVPVNAQPATSIHPTGAIRIVLPNGIHLDIAESTDQLATLIKALTSL